MRWRAKLSTTAPEPRSSKPSSSNAADSGRRPGSSSPNATVRIMAPKTSHAGCSFSSAAGGQARRAPPTSPPLTRTASGQSKVMGHSGGACTASASASAASPAYSARRALLSGSSGSSTTANSARSKRPTNTSVPAPSSAAFALACAKASPTSRSVTSRNPGGRSSACADDVLKRVCGGICLGFALSAWDNYNLADAAATGASRRFKAGAEMADQRTILVCSCEDTMPLDAAAIRRACKGAEVVEGRMLCRAELERFRTAAAGKDSVTVACTQEAPLFAEASGEDGPPPLFVNIRETAGWSKDAAKAGPKIAALLAAAAEPLPEVPYVTLSSEGVVLIYGRDESAVEAGRLLQ